jgi:hypothetical protein
MSLGHEINAFFPFTLANVYRALGNTVSAYRGNVSAFGHLLEVKVVAACQVELRSCQKSPVGTQSSARA